MQILQLPFLGASIALLGAALTVVFCGLGSAKAVGKVGCVASGVMAEKPELYGKFLILEALPATQGIYGLIIFFFLLINGGFFAGTASDISFVKGLTYAFACLPMMIVGYGSAIHQGNVAADGVMMVSYKPDEQVKSLIMAAMVETLAIFSLLTSILAIMMVK